jgi:hypothetical protein
MVAQRLFYFAMAKQRRKQTVMLDQGERVIRARISGVSVAKIAKDEGISIGAVNQHLDGWVNGAVGPQLRHQEYTLLLARNDELIEALRPKALAMSNRSWVREYSAALSRRASLLGLRPPKDVNVRLIADEVQRVTSFDRLDGAVRALIQQRSKTVDG